MISIKLLAPSLLGTIALLCAQSALSVEPKSPDAVHMALRILASVYADMEANYRTSWIDWPTRIRSFTMGPPPCAMRSRMSRPITRPRCWRHSTRQ